MSCRHATMTWLPLLWPVIAQVTFCGVVGSTVMAPLDVSGLSAGESSTTIIVCARAGKYSNNTSSRFRISFLLTFPTCFWGVSHGNTRNPPADLFHQRRDLSSWYKYRSSGDYR